ncbi:MAG: N-6 DNA methylase [Phycisphaerales bacterium]|nr:N-6 DNA methylase [Phycisphaerales bacterium]
MSKRPANAKDGPRLFEHHEQVLNRRIRRQRALFIPKFIREAAANQQLNGAAQNSAYEIAVRWADLETSGNLAKHKETSIDTQFLDQLFGEGLGYQVKTRSPADFHLEHKYTVSGVGIADAALGEFPNANSPTVVVELKNAQTDLDRDRSNGRTAVQQCWDYLNALPGCEWGIVSNFSIIRLYHRSKGTLNYEEFTLQELRSRDRFNEFYAVFERGGLLTSALRQPPRALALLQKTQKRQKEVGDDLYESYRYQRLRLIDHLMREEGKPLDQAIAIAQKLLDRVIFIAFCEDRDILPEKCLERAHSSVPAFSRVTNPRWHNFLGLFHAVDKGSSGVPLIDRFNGGLFAADPEIDDLELDDEPWTTGFKGFGGYDFSEEVNVEVLGHLFERSITELEKLRIGGLFALKANIEGANGNDRSSTKLGNGKAKSSVRDNEPVDSPLSKMPKSAQRKRFGIYYTPPAFTGLLVERTVDALVRERFAGLAKQHKVNPEARKKQVAKNLRAYWTACLDALNAVTVCDPACGSGAFLIRAYDALDAHYKAVIHGLAGAGEDPAVVRQLEDAIPDLILNHNLYGVDLSREGVEITQLALWIRSARKGKTLADLSKHIIHGNSLVSDPSIDPLALNWAKTFPQVFGTRGSGGFSCVIGNPPWEQMMLHDREFFSLTHPGIATAVNAADRNRMIEELPRTNPELYKSYLIADAKAISMLKYTRESGDYPLTGKGRTNLYMCFAERAMKLVAEDGLVGVLVPSGIATDDTTKKYFGVLMDDQRLVSLYDFENRKKIFEDVDGRFKFTALVFGGKNRTTEQADFVFFAHSVEETAEVNKQRHIPLTAADMKLLNPNTRTCPIFRTRRDADLTKTIYNRVPILIDKNRKQGGNPWGVTFKQGLFNQTSDAKKFKKPEVLKRDGYILNGNRWVKNKKVYLPLYEAKMLQAYDHRAAGIVIETENWMRQGQPVDTSPVQHANPEYLSIPRWWAAQAEVDLALTDVRPAYIAYKRITSATNSRTMIACMLPRVAAVNSVCLMLPKSGLSPRLSCVLAANLNAIVFDYVARQKVGGVDLNFFIVEQLPTLPPDMYAAKCPWSKREPLEYWISERVLKLTCTAEDMIPLAQACGFKGSEGNGVHKWREAERMQLRAQLDAAFAHLYGVSEDDFAYMLSTFPSVPEPVIIATRNAYRDLSVEMMYAR